MTEPKRTSAATQAMMATSRFGRRAGVAALAAGAVAIAPGLPAAQAAQTVTSQALTGNCPAAVAFLVPGSTQGNAQTYLGAISQSVADHLGSDLPPGQLQVQTVQYPAIPVWEGIDNAAGAGFTYLQSLAAGVTALGGALANLAANTACPGTHAVLIGDNQGADVIGQYLQSGQVPAAVQQRIVGVAMISDPRFNPADTVDVGSFDPTLSGLFATFQVYTSPNTRALLGVRPAFGAPFAGETVSACNAQDPVCNYSVMAGMICFGTNTWLSFAAAIQAGIPVLIPFSAPWCPDMGYPQINSLAVAEGTPVSTAGLALYLAGKITG